MDQQLLAKIKENNTPNITDNVTQALRMVTEKRAATIANILDESTQLIRDDAFVRRAIYQYGADNGKAMADSMQDANDLEEFADAFTSGLEAKVYEMSLITKTRQEMVVHFHYCPYVNKWLQQNRTAQEMSILCDICMEGDKALATAFDDLHFKLGNTIANGNDVCEISYFKSVTK